MKRLFGILLSIALIVVLITGCSPHVSYNFDTKEFSIAQGQTFELSYEENLSTGDAWQCNFRGEAEFEIVKDTTNKTFLSLFQKGYAKRKILIRVNKAGKGVVYLVRKLNNNEEDPYETRQINVTVTPKKVLGTTGY